MRVVERAGNVVGDGGRIGHAELPLSQEPGAQRFTGKEWRDEKEAARLGGAVIDERQNVGMLKPAQDLDLAAKTLFTDECRDLRAKNLDGNLLLLLEIVRKNDVRRRTSADLRPVGVTRR